MSDEEELSPAEIASKNAVEQIANAIDQSRSFLLEAGAGAGKTYSLVESLKLLVDKKGKMLSRSSQQIACITFTNVAKDEIKSRIDHSAVVHCDTIHAFCWSVISGYQSQLRDMIANIAAWNERLSECGGSGKRHVEYSLGHRQITDTSIHLHHDDVLDLTVQLMEEPKFRKVLVGRYPIILIDEYQDTDESWVASIEKHFLGVANSPQFGFFGDHWQKIYGNGCGKLEHDAVTQIGKEANFRSVLAIVECLNRMRPELPQSVKDPSELGEVRIFHTNNWVGNRKGGGHWGGDLPDVAAANSLNAVKEILVENGWVLSADRTKILMLTHRVLAAQQGYTSLPTVFRYNESFTKKEQPHIAFFLDHLEPACIAFESGNYGAMFEATSGKVPHLKSLGDKERLAEYMRKTIELRASGTVSQVISHLRDCGFPKMPDSIERLEESLAQFNEDDGEDMPRSIAEVQKLHSVPYREVAALAEYVNGHSPFETKHGVKGAEFENVVVVIGRGWNRYNFGQMLEMARSGSEVPEDRRDFFERNRNLFYVVSSRAMRRLAILFTQELSDDALRTVEEWFGPQNVSSLEF